METTPPTTQTPRQRRVHKRILSKDVGDEDPFRFFFEQELPLAAQTSTNEDVPAKSQKTRRESVARPVSVKQATGNIKSATEKPSLQETNHAASAQPWTSISALPTTGIVHSLELVLQTPRKYARWFLTEDERESQLQSIDASPQPLLSSAIPTDKDFQSQKVELMYCNKSFREVHVDCSIRLALNYLFIDPWLIYILALKNSFSLLRPRSMIRHKQSLQNMQSGAGSARGNTPDPLDLEYDPVEDLIATMRALVDNTLVAPPPSVVKMFLHNQNGIIRRLERARNRQNLSKFSKIVGEFNLALSKCRKEGLVLGYTKKRLNSSDVSAQVKALIRSQMNEYASPSLVVHILDQSYARTVASHADKLSKYQPFSNEVYGEINSIFVSLILEKIQLKQEQTFVDLGSGIGNVVLQIAAQSGCNAVGIEIQQTASELAQAQLTEYRARMRFFNKRLGYIALYQGDMLEHPEISSSLMSRADVIFVNNYVFSPELNQGILQKFLDLREGTRVVSLKRFVPAEYKLSLRNVDNIASIFEVAVYDYPRGYVSWTDQGGSWFVQTVNRTRVESFLQGIGVASGGGSNNTTTIINPTTTTTASKSTRNNG